MSGMHVPVTVDATSVRVGDQLLVGGQVFTVRDMTALPRGGRRLDFHDGTSYTMRRATVLYVTRLVAVRGRKPRRAF
ncbi:hypothetical protein RM780_27595 [Streptomyces sp. DSM 44917]|uniref:Uncharacterized protein n=1 Tax=Streptomyces boetiae TaxID=3075541 RepID=A0ABU2LGN1_9ACTN|nr:hypothetical protein [Streptomyces sp. DSM 44917]MDT0310676.1 hypothetical protein [Streptomyces sp. DSM 44917]